MYRAQKYAYSIKLKDEKVINISHGLSVTDYTITYDLFLDEVKKEVEKLLKERNISKLDLKSMEIKFNNLSEEEKFFYELLDDTAISFENSATRKKYPKENWNFAICDTPIQKGHGLFFGLNWGGDDIDQQSVYPPKYKERNWKFVNNSRSFFKEYFDAEIEDLNYSNLCFFRSPDMNHFDPDDWQRAIPLFEKYVDFVKPSWTLMLGKPPKFLIDRIDNFKRHKVINSSNGNRVFGYTGKLFDKYPFGSVPHTESRISTDTRQEIWKKVKENMTIKK